MRFLGRCNNFSMFFCVPPLVAFAVLIAVVSLVLFPIVVLGVAVAVAFAIGCGCCKQEIVICSPLCVHRKLDNLIWLKSLVSVAAVWPAIVGVAGVAVCGPLHARHIISHPSPECQFRLRLEMNMKMKQPRFCLFSLPQLGLVSRISNAVATVTIRGTRN